MSSLPWPASGHCVDRRLPGRKAGRHPGDDAGRSRHQLLAGNARHLCDARLLCNLLRRSPGLGVHSAWLFTQCLDRDLFRGLGQMLYGVVCFAMFFSFFGTVLGGIWADQSWGRFWGWDPKENGALLIVLMNALILHARWAGLVKQRGMAVLAIVGNMVHRLVVVRHQPTRRRLARLRLQQHSGDRSDHFLGHTTRLYCPGSDPDAPLAEFRSGQSGCAAPV